MNASVRIGVRSLLAHRRRLLGTVLSIVLGVAFLTGTMVLGDTLRANFDTLFADADAGTDAVVRSARVLDAPNVPGGVRAPLEESLTAKLRAAPGVSAAEPSVQGAGQLIGADGRPVGGQGPPTLAGNWIDDPKLNPYRLAEGRAPAAPGEAVVNRGAAKAGGLKVGDSTVLRTPDPVRITVVGIATFGADADGMGPSTFTALTLADAQAHLTPRGTGQVSTVRLRSDTLSQRQLVDEIGPLLPDGVEALTGADATAQSTADVSGRFLSLFTTLLLVFAGVALLVATFTIHNTFAIVTAQRTRENALLRALGAGRGQVLGTTLGEALALGVLASALGLLGGFGVAAGLKALFAAIGFTLPTGGTVVHPATILLPLLTGTLVAAASALAPALRAARTAPLAALRDTAVDASAQGRSALVRRTLGALLLVGGLPAVVVGATRGPSLALTVGGALALLAGTVVLGPVAAVLAVRVLGAPLPRLRGVTGALARRNAARNPGRTAATATALMVGVAVVTLFTVFGASVKATLDDTVSRSFAGDLAVTAPATGAGGSGVSPKLAPAVAALPEVRAAVGLGRGLAQVDGHGAQLGVADPLALAQVTDLGRVDGSLADLGTDGLAVSRPEAQAHGWRVGSTVQLRFTDTTAAFTVRALYAGGGVAGDYLISRQAWEPHRVQDADTLVAVALRPGVTVEQGRAAIGQLAAAYGNPQVQTRAEYAESSASGVDMMLSVVYALLALAVLIALLGIANTLTLAVHERTRELGLLRAVGQSRAQLRAMVRWESVLVAAFGTAGGLVLGALLGWALTRASDGAGTGSFALPAGRLAVIALVGLAAGALAGLRPAARAAKLDVLRAVASD
ncbi:ABC transporter substrate-binding protein [Kitasatospora phosalacinea]|uniref:ABC transporter substrate-binding protein n=1 Tax=Kitasatospora phosalacinea TaxID=2065 RepID=A0A9W6QEG6_9ACTN|nr:FtsX-like permease family protein [Kitasatospora phosalacinea]GLW73388.1 ABC transporter substrate-binding protein [Kitasatospora phosalacinea]